MNQLLKKLFFLLLILSSTLIAESLSTQTVVVGTKVAPPFSMKDKDGKWEGMSIELWDLIAKKLELNYELKEYTLKTLLKAVEEQKLDVGIAAITITSERERKFDFTHSYYTTGLSIAIPQKSSEGWRSLLSGIFSYRMLLIVSVLALILFVVGTVTWLVERKKNHENFNPNPIKGIASGIWWAAVTMTTVGYGDMTPKTLGGRLIALFWMFASLLLVSSIIAGVASTLTLAKMDYLISKPEDLARGKVATVRGTVSDNYLQSRKIYPYYYENVSDGLQAIEEKRVDAMVYDAPLLKYRIKERYSENIMVVDRVFEEQNYGIALPTNSLLREQINIAMLEIVSSREWEEIKEKYMGDR